MSITLSMVFGSTTAGAAGVAGCSTGIAGTAAETGAGTGAATSTGCSVNLTSSAAGADSVCNHHVPSFITITYHSHAFLESYNQIVPLPCSC